MVSVDQKLLQGDCRIPAFGLDLAIQTEQNSIRRVSLLSVDGKNCLQSHRKGAKNAKNIRKLGVLPWHCRATASVRLGGEKSASSLINT
jgi:hypothetical protein